MLFIDLEIYTHKDWNLIAPDLLYYFLHSNVYLIALCCLVADAKSYDTFRVFPQRLELTFDQRVIAEQGAEQRILGAMLTSKNDVVRSRGDYINAGMRGARLDVSSSNCCSVLMCIREAICRPICCCEGVIFCEEHNTPHNIHRSYEIKPKVAAKKRIAKRLASSSFGEQEDNKVIMCSCGQEMAKKHLSRHLESKKHERQFRSLLKFVGDDEDCYSDESSPDQEESSMMPLQVAADASDDDELM